MRSVRRDGIRPLLPFAMIVRAVRQGTRDHGSA